MTNNTRRQASNPNKSIDNESSNLEFGNPSKMRRTDWPTARCSARTRRCDWSTLFVVAVMVTSLAHTVSADWDTNCPENCKCTYSSNRKVAKCSGAGYSTVPTTLSPEVQVLVLANNNIRHLQKDDFQKAGLVNLQRLDLSNNQISTIDKDAFSGLRILIELDLGNNMVEKLHPATFTGMEKLRELALTGNKISRLEAHQFPSLYHLQILKLDNCNLRYLHNYAFVNLPNITALRLSSNALETIEWQLLAGNPKLVSLELNNNNWNCDCGLRDFANWLANSDKFSKNDWNCHAPDRLKGSHWASVELQDYACSPSISTSQDIVSVSVGSNASLNCFATGDPLPTITWVAEKKVISNMTSIGESTDTYVVFTIRKEDTLSIESTLQLGVYGDHHPTDYTCIASNPANSVEKVIQVVVGTGDTLDVIDKSSLKVYILIGIGVTLIVLFVLLIILLICCWLRKKPKNKASKGMHGDGTDIGSVMIVTPSTNNACVNPIGKPPRQYEKLPQKDFEMTQIIGNSSGNNASIDNPTIGGGHKSFEELNYPSGGPQNNNNNPIYGGMDPRARLPPLEEETNSSMTGLLPSQHPSASPYLARGEASIAASPSPTLTLQSNVTQQTITSHYPDLLLDNGRMPRTVSPTQMSYHSLVYPPMGGQEWRYSYAHPSDYGTTGKGTPGVIGGSEYTSPVATPMAFSTPQHHQRPGYVTLPRRPRAPSWSGVPSTLHHNPLLSPTGVGGHHILPPAETVYDTLGPRTTADGTSTTDLTRPGSRAALYEPFPPSVAAMMNPPMSPHGGGVALATSSPLYASIGNNSPITQYSSATLSPHSKTGNKKAGKNGNNNPHLRQFLTNQRAPMLMPNVASKKPVMSQTLPRSTPNLLHQDEGLSIPGYNGPPQQQLLEENSEGNGEIEIDPLMKDLCEISDLLPGGLSPNNNNQFSGSNNSNINNNHSKNSLAPTPTQILHSAASPLPRPSPVSSPNSGVFASSNTSYSPILPLELGNNEVHYPGENPNSPLPNPNNIGGSQTKKKVPPKPPPKPAAVAKRLSIASVTSDASGPAGGTVGGTATTQRKNSVTCQVIEDGPDGSEV